MLAEELPDGTFVEAHNILEWRLRPDRLDREAIDFVTRCWGEVDKSATRRRSRRS